MALADPEAKPEIYARNLTYIHYGLSKDAEAALIDISFGLPKGSRTILVGANGGAYPDSYVSCDLIARLQLGNLLCYRFSRENV